MVRGRYILSISQDAVGHIKFVLSRAQRKLEGEEPTKQFKLLRVKLSFSMFSNHFKFRFGSAAYFLWFIKADRASICACIQGQDYHMNIAA